MIHTGITRYCLVFLLPRRQTNTVTIYDSHKKPTVLVRKVKGKPCNIKANVCGSLYSTFKTSF